MQSLIIITIQFYEETFLAQVQIATAGDAPIIVLWIVVLIITDILLVVVVVATGRVQVPLVNIKSCDHYGYQCGPLVLLLDS
jgi:hypothetical protein